MLLSTPFTTTPDDWYCAYDCLVCEGGPNTTDEFHQVTFNNNPLGWESQHDEGCNPGSCSKHRSCHWSFATVGEVWNSARLASGTELVILVRQHQNELKYNIKRQALQMYCESGSLVASLPLRDDQARALEQFTAANH